MSLKERWEKLAETKGPERREAIGKTLKRVMETLKKSIDYLLTVPDITEEIGREQITRIVRGVESTRERLTKKVTEAGRNLEAKINSSMQSAQKRLEKAGRKAAALGLKPFAKIEELLGKAIALPEVVREELKARKLEREAETGERRAREIGEEIRAIKEQIRYLKERQKELQQEMELYKEASQKARERAQQARKEAEQIRRERINRFSHIASLIETLEVGG